MRNLLIVALSLISLALSGQDSLSLSKLDSSQLVKRDSLMRVAAPVVAEGKLLYKSEMASWYGTDLFMNQYQRPENIGGYFSYTFRDETKCIYFNKKANPKVIGTITFDSTYNMETAKVDLQEREFNGYEARLHAIRTAALNLIGSDAFFKNLANASLNLSPLIIDNVSKVYVLTSTHENNAFIIGNDYVITFDQQNNITSKKELHTDVTTFNAGKADDPFTNSMHYHTAENGDIITPTDVCVLMMYERYAKWITHQVVSKNILNIWDCETNELIVLSNDMVTAMNKKVKPKKEKKEKSKASAKAKNGKKHGQPAMPELSASE